MTVKELYRIAPQSFVFVREPGKRAQEFHGSGEYADRDVRKITATQYPMYKSVLEVELDPRPREIEISSDVFTGRCIIDAKVPPVGYGLENVQDKKTGLSFTIIQKGDTYYAYEERESAQQGLWYRY